MGSEGESSSMKVEIQSRKLVKPSAPTPTHLQRLKLSSIDQIQPPFYVRLIFHFNVINCEGRTGTSPERRLALLEATLSEILTLYYPFAGRYVEAEVVISCQDQGVEFVEAKVDGDIDQLVDGDYDAEALVSGPSVLPPSGIATNPLILIQVNSFNCGGLAIGLCFFHKMADMSTMSMFMDAWATACRLETLDHLDRPSFDLSTLMPPKDIIMQGPPPPPVSGLPPEFVMQRFMFSGEAISKLKSMARADYTRVELVTALLSSVLINIDRSKRGCARPFVISHMMNLRKRTALPLQDQNLCGNLYTIITLAPEMESDHQDLELPELAGLIRETIRNVGSEIRKVRDGEALSWNVENAVKAFHGEARKGEEVNIMVFSSWFRFTLYEIDFGWGKPSLISPLPSPFVSIGLLDHNDDPDGIVAWVNLSEGDVARFRNDPDILEYAN